jgi:hypothetical protein
LLAWRRRWYYGGENKSYRNEVITPNRNRECAFKVKEKGDSSL